jgi:hypothetical protein
MTEMKGNMYPGFKTWNPLAGECPHKCRYCSTNALKRYPVIKAKYSGELRLDENAMLKDLGSGNTIFVCAQNDLFAEQVKHNQIHTILNYCKIFPENTYFFQSKNPARMIDYIPSFPKDSILCTTIESNRDNLSCEAPGMNSRAHAIRYLKRFFKTAITIEPIVDFDLNEFGELIKYANPDKINIGGDSKHNHLPEPSKEKILALINELQKFTTIDRKTNLKRLLK